MTDFMNPTLGLQVNRKDFPTQLTDICKLVVEIIFIQFRQIKLIPFN